MVITTIQAGENPEWSHMHFRVERVAQGTQKKILSPNILIHTFQLISIRNPTQQITFLCSFFLQTLKMASNEGDRVNVPQEVSYIITIIIGIGDRPL